MWIAHNGGPCPDGWIAHTGDTCPPEARDARVHIRFRNGVINTNESYGQDWGWGDAADYTIVAYKIIGDRPTEPIPTADDWTPWHGGECPEHLQDVQVYVRLRSGSESRESRLGQNWRWNHTSSLSDIVAYRTLNEFIPWSGGINPAGTAIVEVKFRGNPEEIHRGRAEAWFWGDSGDLADIVAYRIIVEEVQPPVLDGWILWSGGECPAGLEDVRVEVRFRSGRTNLDLGGNWYWGHGATPSTIVAYRVPDGAPPIVNPSGFTRLSGHDKRDIALVELQDEAASMGLNCYGVGRDRIEVKVPKVILRDGDGEEFEFFDFTCRIEFNSGRPSLYIDGDGAHPHIGGNGLCMGDNHKTMIDLIERNRYAEFLSHMVVTLSSYNPRSAYRQVGVTYRTCSECDERVSGDEIYSCDRCGRNICEDCSYTCHNYDCGTTLCSNHRYYCDKCDNYYCFSHYSITHDMCDTCRDDYVECTKCDNLVDSDDANYCDECGYYYCDSHFNQIESMCEECLLEKETDDDDDTDGSTEELAEVPATSIRTQRQLFDDILF